MRIIISLMLILILAGCSSTKEEDMKKLDMGLRMEVEKARENDSAEMIRFLGKAENEINSEVRNEIESTGVKIEGVTNKIFTASGSVEQILNLASKNFIIRLEKSGKNKLLN